MAADDPQSDASAQVDATDAAEAESESVADSEAEEQKH